MKPFASESDKEERREMLRFLRNTPPEQMAEIATAAAVSAFQRAASRVPAYRELLAEAGVDAGSVTDIDAFTRHAPLLNKDNTFVRFPISQLCLDGNLDGVRSMLTSSGYSGKFCFGVNTQENLARSSKSIDLGLQLIFDVDNRSTLVINGLPMGVKVNTKAAVLAETSVRDDMIYALVKAFAPEFDQIVMVGEGSFIKKIIEDGQEYQGIDWKALRVHIITGEEGIAENYRTYIGGMIGADFDDPDGKIVMSSLGVAELDLNIFHETRETVAIRRMAHADPALREKLFGPDTDGCCPMFFIYYPHRCLLEQLPATNEYDELVISMLSEEMKIPLLRYRSGDYGKIFTYGEVCEILQGTAKPMQPDLKLPFVAVSGRGKFLPTAEGKLYPEAVKEAIYADARFAILLTGCFRLSGDNGATLLEFQLRKGRKAYPGAAEEFLAHLSGYSKARPRVVFYDYAAFPHGMELDWERKFQYL
jgi:phenylacetate-CoA ligase